MGVLDTRIPPPLLALAIGIAMAVGAGHAPRIETWVLARKGLAALIAVVALAFDLGAVLQFRRARTTIVPWRPDKSTALVTDGVYRWSRNPMYVGLALLLTALAVYRGSLPALIGPVVFVLYITRFQIAPEERVMQQLFGAQYDAYRARVRRWL